MQNYRPKREGNIPIEAGLSEPTLRGLIGEYQRSSAWTKLAEATRRNEQCHVKAIEEEFGDMPLSVIEAKGSRAMFLEWRDRLAESTPRAADAKLGRLQRILRFGFELEKIERHPLVTFERVYSVDRAEVIWRPDHFKALHASRASQGMKFAAFLALHTGQRRGDLISLRWSNYDGNGISFIQSKTRKRGSSGRRIFIPATQALKATLDERHKAQLVANKGNSVDNLHILRGSRGGAYTSNGFRLAWEHAFKASGIKPIEVDGKTFRLHFHDIRGTAVTLLAEAGATVPEIATITGHTLASVNRMLERYLSRTNTLAFSAIAKLDGRLASSAASCTPS